MASQITPRHIISVSAAQSLWNRNLVSDVRLRHLRPACWERPAVLRAVPGSQDPPPPDEGAAALLQFEVCEMVMFFLGFSVLAVKDCNPRSSFAMCSWVFPRVFSALIQNFQLPNVSF